MSPASYRAAPPRVAVYTLAQPRPRLQIGPHVSRTTAVHPRATPPGQGRGEGEPDPGGVDGGADEAAAFAAWYALTASSSAFRALPCASKSPLCCAALRS